MPTWHTQEDTLTCPADDLLEQRLREAAEPFRNPDSADKRQCLAFVALTFNVYWAAQPLVDQSKVPGLAKTEKLLRTLLWKEFEPTEGFVE